MNEIQLPNVEHSYATEILRKGIHLSSLSIPVIYYFIPKSTALAILIPLFLLFAIPDLARLLHRPTGRLVERYFGFLLRRHEQMDRGGKLTGATYVLLSAILCILIFPKVIVITAFAIMIISDTSAALIGRKLGRRPFLSKSLEGTAAFFVSALLVVALSPKIAYIPAEYAIGAAAALLGALVEATNFGLDDNLTIPISIGIIMWALYALFLPSVNIYRLDQFA
jgi:dolichol kinase